MSSFNMMENVKENYDYSNKEPISYLNENLQPDDIIIYSDIGNGGVIAALIDTNKQFFLNLENWSIEEAYKAYNPQMEVKGTVEEAIKEAKNRIFIIDTGELSLYNKIYNEDQYKQVSINKFEPRYKNYTYNIIILEKVK